MKHEFEKQYVYENERRGLGFNSIFQKSRLLPTDRDAWSDKNGAKLKAPDQIECPNGYYWDGIWEVKCDDKRDKEGWKYAFNFNSESWKKALGTGLFVRRRKWVRRKKMKDSESLENEKSMKKESSVKIEEKIEGEESDGNSQLVDLSYLDMVYSCEASLTKPQIQQTIEKKIGELDKDSIQLFELSKMHIFEFLKEWKLAWSKNVEKISKKSFLFIIYDLETRNEEILWSILTPIITESGEYSLTSEEGKQNFKKRWQNFAIVVPGLSKNEIVIPPIEALISNSSIPKIRLQVHHLKYDWKSRTAKQPYNK
eukprot:TRINITY_DN5255_c0_g1_i1.p1 TRINITY_DN5255_c0_g1~~TRINITY_DN5255_c0_g1_i1.p1  ORF type:complete len:312 (+),score=96.61 TRINITY_DN5255_c0_g1_i1:3-938(+)